MHANTTTATPAPDLSASLAAARSRAPRAMAAWETTDTGFVILDAVQSAQAASLAPSDYLTGLQVRQAVAALDGLQDPAPVAQATAPAPASDNGAMLRSWDKARHALPLVGLEHVSRAVDMLPVAELANIQAADGRGDFKSWRAVRDVQTGEPWHVASDRYALIQYPALFAPVLESAQALGLNVAARIDTLDNGARCKARLLVANPEHVLDVGTAGRDSDPIMVGATITASHDGSGAVRVQPYLMRLVCANGNVMPTDIAHVALRHQKSGAVKVGDLTRWWDQLLASVPAIAARYKASQAVPVTYETAALAALGAGIPARHVANWAPDVTRWEPTMPATGAGTLWAAYNSLTAYITHSTQAGTVDNRDNLLAVTADLLEPGALDALVARGREQAEALRTKRAEQAAAGDRRTVPLIPGIVG